MSPNSDGPLIILMVLNRSGLLTFNLWHHVEENTRARIDALQYDCQKNKANILETFSSNIAADENHEIFGAEH